jgi:hypothetical protein
MTIRDMGQNAKLYGILIFTHHAREARLGLLTRTMRLIGRPTCAAECARA